MTLNVIYELDPSVFPRARYKGCVNMNFLVKYFGSYRLTNIQRDRQTGPKLYTTPLRGWSKITPSVITKPAEYDMN